MEMAVCFHVSIHVEYRPVLLSSERERDDVDRCYTEQLLVPLLSFLFVRSFHGRSL